MAPGGRADTAPASGTVSLRQQTESGSFRSTYLHGCAQTDPSTKALKGKESTKHIEAPGAVPSTSPAHHTLTPEGAAAFLLPVSLSFSLPCAPPDPGSFLVSLGPLRPVPLSSELGWALLFAEISRRDRAIFCHRQQVRLRE